MHDSLTWIELDKKAFWHNVAQLAACCANRSALGVVLKGNAYGHGMQEIAQLAQEHPDIRWLFVAALSEAVALREQGISKPILAMSYHDVSLEKAVRHQIAVAVYDRETVRELNACAEKLGTTVAVHIKVDSNMCRLGVLPADFPEFVAFVATCPAVKLEGVFTHLSDINNPDLIWSHEQARVFDAAITSAHFTYKPLLHVFGCGALTLDPLYDLIRAGTNLFGFWKSAVQQERFLAKFPTMTLEQVMSWKTKIIQIKTVPAGSYVGYNRSFCTLRPTTIAVLPIGYFDGYPRALSNKGQVRIGSLLAPVIGIVSMNLTTIDITDCPDIHVGDEVVLLGKQPGVTVNEVAALAATINNEFVTRINPQIRRCVVGDR